MYVAIYLKFSSTKCRQGSQFLNNKKKSLLSEEMYQDNVYIFNIFFLPSVIAPANLAVSV